MPKSIFLSYNRVDKTFARWLAADLSERGVRVWLDDAEIRIGDSLIEKIRQGIDEVDYVGVILSPDSVNSPWVQREIDVSMNQEIDERKVRVLPLMYRNCDLPGFLKGKAYADFSDSSKYQRAFAQLCHRLEVENCPLLPEDQCQWQRIFPNEKCDLPSGSGIAFCRFHVGELEGRAAQIITKGKTKNIDIYTKDYITLLLTAASTVAAHALVRHWDFIWQNIYIGGMKPPGYAWKSENGVFLGRPHMDNDCFAGFSMERLDEELIIKAILDRLPTDRVFWRRVPNGLNSAIAHFNRLKKRSF